ncbi:hypothetical protein QAD02_004892 [Eretmocerus hayati]|uniref:Uncharacterized protein n=1 Tax=Eretmocerus hayati TaxID=131215 RepID=A0ACC2NQU4_9HYME|nr:hypothetical protein QAD02_004892 [Eretmocerus hayati]
MHFLVYWTDYGNTSIISEQDLDPNKIVGEVTSAKYSGLMYEAKIMAKSYDREYPENLTVSANGDAISHKKPRSRAKKIAPGEAPAKYPSKTKNSTCAQDARLLQAPSIFDVDQDDNNGPGTSQRTRQSGAGTRERDREQNEAREMQDRQLEEERERVRLIDQERENQRQRAQEEAQYLEAERERERAREETQRLEAEREIQRAREEAQRLEAEREIQRQRAEEQRLELERNRQRAREEQKREQQRARVRQVELERQRELQRELEEVEQHRLELERELQRAREREQDGDDDDQGEIHQVQNTDGLPAMVHRGPGAAVPPPEQAPPAPGPVPDYRQAGAGRVQLCDVYSVWVDAGTLTYLSRFWNNPNELTRQY